MHNAKAVRSRRLAATLMNTATHGAIAKDVGRLKVALDAQCDLEVEWDPRPPYLQVAEDLRASRSWPVGRPPPTPARGSPGR